MPDIPKAGKYPSMLANVYISPAQEEKETKNYPLEEKLNAKDTARETSPLI